MSPPISDRGTVPNGITRSSTDPVYRSELPVPACTGTDGVLVDLVISALEFSCSISSGFELRGHVAILTIISLVSFFKIRPHLRRDVEYVAR